MTRMPPRLPRPATPQRSLRIPPDPLDNRAGLGVRNKNLLKFGIFIIRQVFLHKAREQLGLDKADHLIIIRLCRSTSMPERAQMTANVRVQRPPKAVRWNARLGLR